MNLLLGSTNPDLQGVCKELQREDEGEALVGVPEDGGVADGVHGQRHAVVQELGRHGPPRVLRGERATTLFYLSTVYTVIH